MFEAYAFEVDGRHTHAIAAGKAFRVDVYPTCQIGINVGLFPFASRAVFYTDLRFRCQKGFGGPHGNVERILHLYMKIDACGIAAVNDQTGIMQTVPLGKNRQSYFSFDGTSDASRLYYAKPYGINRKCEIVHFPAFNINNIIAHYRHGYTTAVHKINNHVFHAKRGAAPRSVFKIRRRKNHEIRQVKPFPGGQQPVRWNSFPVSRASIGKCSMQIGGIIAFGKRHGWWIFNI